MAVLACWLAAYLLRYEGRLEKHFMEMALQIPYVVGCQMGALYYLGLYRRLWRYVTIMDLMDIMRGVSIGTFGAWLLALVFASRSGTSTSVFIIDAVLVMLSVGGMRIALKALRFHFALRWRDGVRRVLVVGAGDAGELAVREMLTNLELRMQPVGFVDDDPGLQRHSINGVKVLGTCNHLIDIIHRHKVDEVLIACGTKDPEVFRKVVHLCDGHGVDCREIRGLIV